MRRLQRCVPVRCQCGSIVFLHRSETSNKNQARFSQMTDGLYRALASSLNLGAGQSQPVDPAQSGRDTAALFSDEATRKELPPFQYALKPQHVARGHWSWEANRWRRALPHLYNQACEEGGRGVALDAMEKK